MSSRFMDNLKSFSKKVAAVAVAVCLGLPSAGALAKPETTTTKAHESLRQTLHTSDHGEVLSFVAGSISGGSGSLPCYMTSGNYWAVVQAYSGPNDNTEGSIECYLEYPSGNTVSIGLIPASNGESTELLLYFLPFGQYHFIYEANILDELEVQGYIYD